MGADEREYISDLKVCTYNHRPITFLAVNETPYPML